MSRVAHLVFKDVRHLRVPVALWLALQVLATGLFAHLSSGEQVDSLMWLGAMHHWISLIVGLLAVMGYVLAGFVVLQDPPVGSTSFWMTRPITRTTNFLAKAMVTLGLFVLAPVLVLVPLWWAFGFSSGQVFFAGAEFMLWQSLITLLAVAMASLSANLAEFLFAGIAVIVLHALCGAKAVTASFFQDVPRGVWASRTTVIQTFLIAPPLIGLVVHQFLSGHTRRSWTLVAATLAVTLIVRTAWPWDILPSSARSHLVNATERAEDRDFILAIKAIEVGSVAVESSVPQRGSLVYVPRGGAGRLRYHMGEDAAVDFLFRRAVPDSAVLAAIRRADAPQFFRWVASPRVKERNPPALPSGEVHFAGGIAVSAYHARVLGTLSTHLGTELQSGGDRVKIVGRSTDAQSGAVSLIVEERRPWLGLREGLKGLGRNSVDRGRDLDVYVLENRRTGFCQVLPLQSEGSVNFSSILIGFRRLTLPVELNESDLADAALIKVRFTEERCFWRELDQSGVQVTEKEKPL